MITLPLSNEMLQLRQTAGITQVYDPLRRRWVALSPEEHVRQLLLHHLIATMQYPKALIAVEKKIEVGGLSKRFDAVVFSRMHEPWMLVECKEPQVPVSAETLHQLLLYHRVLSCRYWLLTNGHQTFCADAANPMAIRWLDALPLYD